MRYYSFNHGSKKWYKKISYYFLEAALINSFIIFNQASGDQIPSLKDYKLKIIEALLELEAEEIPLSSEFFQSNICTLELLGAGKQLDCQVCSNRSPYKQKGRKRTGY